jgi:hypothetical protein
VTREVRNYHKLYPELKKNVWPQPLNGFQCVIMPYFAPIAIEDRPRSLIAIKDIILPKFAEKKLKFKQTDQRWRHVGKFDDTVYLFDLADLVDVPAGVDVVTEHIKELRERCPPVDDAPPTPTPGSS